MMKVLLVDDEIFTIRMLQKIIHWKELGLELSDYAQNGKAAYEKVLRDAPDIIISDIRMPESDGLEFLRRVRNYDPGIKTIIMSAYADFSYVKEGLKLGCSDYILKPVDESELEHALRKVIFEIQGEKEKEQMIEKSARQLDHLNLYQYMRTGNGRNKIIRSKQEFRMKDFRIFILQVNSMTIDEYDNSANIEIGHEGYITNVLKQLLSGKVSRYAIFDYEEDCWVMLLDGMRQTDCGELAKRIISGMTLETGISMRICFSPEGQSLEELPVLYEEARSLSRYGFYIGETDILGYGYNCNKGELDEVRTIGIMKDMEQAVKDRNREKVLAILNEAFELSSEFHPGKVKNLHELCYQMIVSIRKYVAGSETGRGETTSKYRELYEITYEKLTEIPSLKELKETIQKIAGYIPEDSNEDVGKTYSKPVKDSLVFIDKRYAENLSLEEICASISVSKNYFCYLFKRETGMSIWNYLTVVRMQHAKKLLEETSLKSYEIAFQVGYDNPSYFSKLFKKYENMTPNEYREKDKK